MCQTLVSVTVVLVRRLSLDSDDLGFPDRDVVSCYVGRIPGKGRGAVGVFTKVR